MGRVETTKKPKIDIKKTKKHQKFKKKLEGLFKNDMLSVPVSDLSEKMLPTKSTYKNCTSTPTKTKRKVIGITTPSTTIKKKKKKQSQISLKLKKNATKSTGAKKCDNNCDLDCQFSSNLKLEKKKKVPVNNQPKTKKCDIKASKPQKIMKRKKPQTEDDDGKDGWEVKPILSAGIKKKKKQDSISSLNNGGSTKTKKKKIQSECDDHSMNTEDEKYLRNLAKQKNIRDDQGKSKIKSCQKLLTKNSSFCLMDELKWIDEYNPDDHSIKNKKIAEKKIKTTKSNDNSKSSTQSSQKNKNTKPAEETVATKPKKVTVKTAAAAAAAAAAASTTDKLSKKVTKSNNNSKSSANSLKSIDIVKKVPQNNVPTEKKKSKLKNISGKSQQSNWNKSLVTTTDSEHHSNQNSIIKKTQKFIKKPVAVPKNQNTNTNGINSKVKLQDLDQKQLKKPKSNKKMTKNSCRNELKKYDTFISSSSSYSSEDDGAAYQRPKKSSVSAAILNDIYSKTVDNSWNTVSDDGDDESSQKTKINKLEESAAAEVVSESSEEDLVEKKARDQLAAIKKLKEKYLIYNQSQIDHDQITQVEENQLVPFHINISSNESTATYDEDDDDSSFESCYTERESSLSEEESYDSADTEPSSISFSSSDYTISTDSDDEDYRLPAGYDEDIYIPRGVAKIHDIHDNNLHDFDNIEFDNNCTHGQIIELTSTTSTNQQHKNNQYEETNSIQSNDSCPTLVPITYESTINCPHNQSSDSEGMNFEFFSESDLTEGSLDRQKDFKNQLFHEPTTIMIPEIFKSSTNNAPISIKTPLIELPSNELCNKDEIPGTTEFYSPLYKIQNTTNINKSYKISSINGLETHNITSKKKKIIKNTPINTSANIKFYIGIDEFHVLALLKEPIYIYGTLKLKLLAGAVEVFGYQPNVNEIIVIFSPRGYSSLNVKPIKNNQDNLSSKLSQQFIDDYINIFFKRDLTEIVKLFDTQKDALVLLTSNNCDKDMNMLQKYMQENLFPNKNTMPPLLDRRSFYRSEIILQCVFMLKTSSLKYSIQIDPKWQTIQLNAYSKMLVIGGKSTGKSTLIRYLINRHLKIYPQILLIDLDIGQSELFIPQTVSVYILNNPLLGPGYFQKLQPLKSIIFGDINPLLSPCNYLKITKQLIQFCYNNSELHNIPWFINTMGYVKGFGNELIAKIIKYLQPTDIIQLQSEKITNNYEYLMFPDVINTIPFNIFSKDDDKIIDLKHRLIIFNSIVKCNEQNDNELNMKAKDLRYAMIVTRLGLALGENDFLTQVTPVCVPIDAIEIIIFGEDSFKVLLEKEYLLSAINGNLIYLCHKSHESIDCYGIGFVRGIDFDQKILYLLPAMAHELLENVNCLAICNIPLPTSILLNQGPKICGITPYIYTTNVLNVSKSIHQQYHRGQHKKENLLPRPQLSILKNP